MGKLDGKVAVVTGASKGIGAGIARAMGREGVAVVVNYSSSREGAEKVVGEIVAAGGRAVAVGADVSKVAGVDRLFAEAVRAFGAPNVVVNNAGVFAFGPFVEVTEETFHWHFNINVLGTVLMMQAALRHFPAAGGSIVNISSIVGSHARPLASIYASTKAAVDNLTRSVALEAGPRNIRVNAIAPGHTQSEGSDSLFADVRDSQAAESPLKRMGAPDDIARVAVFLASDDAAWITGEVIRVGGGVI